MTPENQTLLPRETLKDVEVNSAEQQAYGIQVPEHFRWFVENRFGLFIHWGIYAMPARHEWMCSRERLPREHYQRYFRHFYPDRYDPRKWARLARKAGMRYFVVTTKHHDGFCLWDSQYTDFKATNTPWGKDLLRPMVEAFREEGLKVGFYHSLVDWNHEDFLVGGDPHHPMRDDAESVNKDAGRKMERYSEYLHNQVRELLTDFGKVDYLFFDFSYPEIAGEMKGRAGWQSEKLLKMIRDLQPDILLNDRLDLADVPGAWDLKTPEQYIPQEWPRVNGQRVMWETCQTFSGSWGYNRDEMTWKSKRQLLSMLVETVSKGGNLLLNVGPNARGELDTRAVERLEAMGEWLDLHERAIYGCTALPEDFVVPENCMATWNPKTNRVYLHLMSWPLKNLYLSGWEGWVEYAQLLHDGSETPIQCSTSQIHQSLSESLPEGTLALNLPPVKPDQEIPVIEVFLKNEKDRV